LEPHLLSFEKIEAAACIQANTVCGFWQNFLAEMNTSV
jgi:hypothetical protein